MNEAIKLANVVKQYDNGRRAVNDVTLNIDAGSTTFIYGPPGNGKTALVRLITGLEHPSAGEIVVLGEAVHKMREEEAADFRNRNISVMQRAPVFLDSVTVLENVMLPLAVRRVPAEKRQRLAKEQLLSLGLMYAAYARPFQLSPFEQQKTALARALISEPKLLIFDDLSADMSSKDVSELQGILKALEHCGQYTILEFSGSPLKILNPDRTIKLEDGKISEEFDI